MEALQIVKAASASDSDWPSNDAGLAIWAIGQMGMLSTLDRIRDMLPELEAKMYERYGCDHRV